ncbi:MAG: hypothetical protein V4733_11670 [Verrucomicrobiota bacterium]
MKRTGFFVTIGVIVAAALLSPLFLLRVAREIPPRTTASAHMDDATLVRSLLAQNLDFRTFSFASIVRSSTGKSVIPLNDSAAHQETIAAISRALDAAVAEMNSPKSPARALRRINEASRFFEDAIMKRINVTAGIRCEIPAIRSGTHQRAGYPDLRIVHLASRTVFYLDPKLVESGSETSTLRSFYFEPKLKTSKINDDAIHLVAGISHDGEPQQWKFTGWKLVDLSKLQVRLKAEFQASNAELYQPDR